MDEKTWIRLNVFLRVIVMAILVIIGIEIFYFKYGYVDPDDTKMKYDLGNITRSITCRDALYYYADKEWHIYDKKNISYKYQELILDNFNISQ